MAIIKGPTGEEYDTEALDCFLIIEGRYYLAQWCVRIPNQQSKFGKGGDVTALIWRKLEEPIKWTLQYRFRWYRTKGAWDGQDEKKWTAGRIEGAEKDVLENTREVFRLMAFAAGHTDTGEFLVQGDNGKFYELSQKNPPKWMHQQSVLAE